jgi:hypothetical protein
MLADDPNAPLVLADGTKINPATGGVIKDRKYSDFVEIPAAKDAIAAVSKARRSVAELPVPGQQMNALSLILFYTMFGLSEGDIALQLGSVSVPQIKKIKQLPEYTQLSQDILKSVLEHEAQDVRTHITKHAMGAAQKVIDTMEEDGALGFAAAKDILDRAGHRPADVVEHKHKMEGGLRIEYIEKSDKEAFPVIDGDFINVTPKEF